MKTLFNVQSLKFAVAALMAAFVLLAGFAGSAHAMLTAKANHDHITIDFFYHGSSVSIKGIADAGTELAIKVTSPESHQTMKKKGKVGGVLWMNVGTLSFEQTPNFYEVFSTKNIDEMLPSSEQEKYLLGYPALAKHVEINGADGESDRMTWFKEFVKFKEDQHLYLSSAGKITTTALPDGHQEYFILTDWPYQAAPGEYTVTVYAVKDHKVIEQAETKVKVEQVGMVKTLATMASNNAAFYGFLSIGIALGAGFGVGLIFRKGGGAH
ncbi:MAG: TIGR02186 family protein [Nitrospiraceae bacterium]|nr:TIGR02186 family protein [Nitrospiraceae bacterium]